MHSTYYIIAIIAIIAILCIAAGLWGFGHHKKQRKNNNGLTMEECGWDVSSGPSPHYSAEYIAEVDADIKNHWNGPTDI